MSEAQLISIVERIEALEAEKAEVAEQVKGVYAEAKSNGYDVKTLRELVKLRKLRDDERQERSALLETYMAAVGMDTK